MQNGNDPLTNLKTWLSTLNDKEVKPFLLYGESGIGKSYFIENKFKKAITINKKPITFGLKIITNNDFDDLLDQLASMKDESSSKIIKSFLESHFETMSVFDFIDEKTFDKTIMVINEKQLYNFSQYKTLILKIIDTNVRYPIILILDQKHNKLLTTLKKKTIYGYLKDPDDEVIKTMASGYFKANEVVNKTNNVYKLLSQLSNNNLDKLFVLLDDLVDNYCENNVITNAALNKFSKSIIVNNNKESIFETNSQLLTNYVSIIDSLNKFRHEEVSNPLVMEQLYCEKFIYYNQTHKDSVLDTYPDIIKRLTKSFDYANQIDAHINNQQRRNLMNIYGYYSCALPSYLLSLIDCDSKYEAHINNKITFPHVMNKSSIEKINTKQIMLIYESFNIMNIEYYMYIGDYVRNVIAVIENEIGNKEKSYKYWIYLNKMKEFINYYKIDALILEKLLKINKLQMKQIKFTKALINELFE